MAKFWFVLQEEHFSSSNIDCVRAILKQRKSLIVLYWKSLKKLTQRNNQMTDIKMKGWREQGWNIQNMCKLTMFASLEYSSCPRGWRWRKFKGCPLEKWMYILTLFLAAYGFLLCYKLWSVRFQFFHVYTYKATHN